MLMADPPKDQAAFLHFFGIGEMCGSLYLLF